MDATIGVENLISTRLTPNLIKIFSTRLGHHVSEKRGNISTAQTIGVDVGVHRVDRPKTRISRFRAQ